MLLHLLLLLPAISLKFNSWVNETEQSLFSLAAQPAKVTVPTLAGTEIDVCVLWREKKKAPVVLGEKGKHRENGNGG